MLAKISAQKNYVKALIYGSFGAGKTHLACSSARNKDMSPVLLVDVEGGVVSTKEKSIVKTPTLKTLEEVDAVFWQIANRNGEYKNFKTVIMDSGSALQNMVLLSLLSGGKHSSADLLSPKMYNICTLKVSDIVSRFVNLDTNFIMTAAERKEYTTEDPEKKAKLGPSVVRPDFTPSLGTRLSHKFSFIWYLIQNEDGSRSMLTDRSGPYMAKTRGPSFAEAIGKIVENPDLSKLYETLQQTESKQGE